MVQAIPEPRPPLRLRFWPTERPIALSLGDGTLVLSTGWLARGTQADFAASLAHEAAHELLGHGPRFAATTVGGGLLMAGTLALAPLAAPPLLAAGVPLLGAYARGQEYEADALGLWLYERAGYPRAAYLAHLRHLATFPRPDRWLSLHPDLQARLRRLEAGPVRVPVISGVRDRGEERQALIRPGVR